MVSTAPSWREACRRHFLPWLLQTPTYDSLAILRGTAKRPFEEDDRHRWMFCPAVGGVGMSVMASFETGVPASVAGAAEGLRVRGVAGAETALHVSVWMFEVIERPPFDALPLFNVGDTSKLPVVGVRGRLFPWPVYFGVGDAAAPGVRFHLGGVTDGGVVHLWALDRSKIEEVVRAALEAGA